MKLFEERLTARGHPNITARHKTTFEFTKDESITIKATCIIGVKASKGLLDFSEKFKQAVSRDGALIKIIIKAGPLVETVEGFGSSKLSLNHPTDIVCRKSLYTCSRTVMIGCSKAACDFSPEFKRLLTSMETLLKITIQVVQ